MKSNNRSSCPINLTLEVVGDRWSLLIIRDIIFGNRRHFRELLTQSLEGIASNILAERLKRLVAQGILTRKEDLSHKQKALYSLTARGIELLPVLAQMSGWGLRHFPVGAEMGARAKLLEAGGPALWAEFMEELKELHLECAQPRRGKVHRRPANRRSVLERMQSAHGAAGHNAARAKQPRAPSRP